MQRGLFDTPADQYPTKGGARGGDQALIDTSGGSGPDLGASGVDSSTDQHRSPGSEEREVDELVVATDGSALGNPGPGGWSWYVDEQWWASGGETLTTNNIMELTAVWDLLCCVERDRRLVIMADSRYVIDALTKWVWGWKRRGWKTANGGDVANRELIEKIHNSMAGREVRFVWVRGHNGHPLNEAADRCARNAAKLAKAGAPSRSGCGQ